MTSAPRIALLGAFPFPAPLGSQLYVLEQARALAAAGGAITVLCYGHGDGRTSQDFELLRVAPGISPRRLRAGPDARKPLADLALGRLLRRSHRKRRFDVVLAHNAEAMLIAGPLRRALGVPILYVAHTLWASELASYAPRHLAPLLGPLSGRLGQRLDARCASRADAVIALSRDGAAGLAPHARGPLLQLPPGARPTPEPSPRAVERACTAHALEAEGYAVYAGNLDRYQDLEAFDAAAGEIAPRPCVAVTHDARPRRFEHLRVVRTDSPTESALLVRGARLAVLPRRESGGFPMKLLSYMEAGRAIVAHQGVADTLVSGESGWLLPPGAAPSALAEGLRALWEDDATRDRLGRGARSVLEREHAWPLLARQTLAFLARVCREATAPPVRAEQEKR